MRVVDAIMYVLTGVSQIHPTPPDEAIHPTPPEGVRYPFNSVPFGGDNDPEQRRKRWACSLANHHPRTYTGSWCFGYGYVCGRCYMYADPVPQLELQARCDALNRLPPEEQQMAAARLSGGGPRR